MIKRNAFQLNFPSFRGKFVAVVKLGVFALLMLMIASNVGHGSNLENVPQVQGAMERVHENNLDAHAYPAAKGMKINQNFEQDLKVALRAKFQTKAPVQVKAINFSSVNMIYAYLGIIGLVALIGIKKAFFH